MVWTSLLGPCMSHRPTCPNFTGHAFWPEKTNSIDVVCVALWEKGREREGGALSQLALSSMNGEWITHGDHSGQPLGHFSTRFLSELQEDQPS